MKRGAVVLLLSVLAACSTRPIPPSEATPGQVFAFATPAADTVPVTVTRDAGMAGMACGIEVLVEGRPAAMLYARETVTLHVPGEEAIIAARPAGSCGLFMPARGLQETEVRLRQSRPPFFRVGFDGDGRPMFSRTGLR